MGFQLDFFSGLHINPGLNGVCTEGQPLPGDPAGFPVLCLGRLRAARILAKHHLTFLIPVNGALRSRCQDAELSA